jgi:hypothetical protein
VERERGSEGEGERKGEKVETGEIGEGRRGEGRREERRRGEGEKERRGGRDGDYVIICNNSMVRISGHRTTALTP